jgi:hypothetical protein
LVYEKMSAYFIDGPVTLGSTATSTSIKGNIKFVDGAPTTGDIVYTNGSGILTPIAIGSLNQVLAVGGSSIPGWVTQSTSNLTGVLPIANGGTNSSTALSGSSIMTSNGTSIIQGSAGTTTTVLHGNAAGVPTYSAVSLTADVTGVLPVVNGGTGQSSYTDGQILIGNSSGNTLTKASLTAGTGISITPGGGSIEIAATGGSSNTTVYDTPQTNTVYSVPAAAKGITVILLGSGGSGSGGLAQANNTGGAGGGAGTYRLFTIPVTSADTVLVTVGTGPDGGAVANIGTAGTSSILTINSKTIVAAAGGGGSTGSSTVGGGGGGSAGSQSAADGAATNSAGGSGGASTINGSYAISVSGVAGGAGNTGTGVGGAGTSGGTAITRPDVIIGGGGGGGSRGASQNGGTGGQCQGGLFTGGSATSGTASIAPGSNGGASAMSNGGISTNDATVPLRPSFGAGGAGGSGSGGVPGNRTAGGPGGHGYASITWF